MARKDALLRLHERLQTIRDGLRKKLIDENQFPDRVNSGTGDVGDVANDGAQTELNSQLAALESRELAQIERAIELIREGRYGTCELCDGPIPIARLQALPYTLLCVNCQRKQEEMGGDGAGGEADWESVFELEGRMSDREISIGDIDLGE